MNPRGSFGGYELLALLAQGELTEVWLARQANPLGFEKLVVVKRLNERLCREPEYVDRFLDEARINSHLHHTNVLSVYELGEVEGRYFLAMEYVEGMPLGLFVQRTIERLSDIPIPIAGCLIVQAAAGLDYAHDALGPDGLPLRVVQRDLSPVNLLLGWDGILKIADFGVATAAGRRTHTVTGTVRGTPTYMSPEHVAGRQLDRRADVFGLGILAWELLTGKRLFRRETSEATYDAIMRGEAQPPSSQRPEITAEIDALVLRALSRRPEDRPPTAAAFGKAFDQVLRRDGLSGAVTDVRHFLDEHFVLERMEQEQLIARVSTTPVLDDPVFARAEHGLDVAAYTDGDTDRDSEAPVHEPVHEMDSPAPAAPSPSQPGAADAVTATPAALAPATQPTSLAFRVIFVVLVILALIGGVIYGHTHRHTESSHRRAALR